MVDYYKMKLEYAVLLEKREDMNRQRNVLIVQLAEIERQMRVAEYNWYKALKEKDE